MKNNILLIAHNENVLNNVAKYLSKQVSMRTLDFNKYVEYDLGRDEKFVIDNLGLKYYWSKYNKVYGYLDDFEDSLIISTPRICLSEYALDRALKELYVIVIDIPLKEQEKVISQYVSKKGYIFKSNKTKLINNFRKLKLGADIVVKYKNNCEETAQKIVIKMLEETNK